MQENSLRTQNNSFCQRKKNIVPNDIKIILTFVFYSPLFGDAIDTTIGEKWRHDRKLLKDAFAIKVLNNYSPVFNRHTHLFLDSLDSFNFVVEHLQDSMVKMSLAILCDTLLGQSQGPSPILESHVPRVLELFVLRMLNPALRPDWAYALTAQGKENKKVVKELWNFSQNCVQQKKKEIIQIRSNSVASRAAANWDANYEKMIKDGDKKGLCLLDLLVSHHLDGDLSEADATAHLLGFIVGGFDSVAVSLTFVLYLLATHDEVQAKVIN